MFDPIYEMVTKEKLELLKNIGMFKTLSFLNNFTKKENQTFKIYDGIALVNMGSFSTALNILERIDIASLETNTEKENLIESLLTCYMKLNKLDKLAAYLRTNELKSTFVSHKIDLLVADAFYLCDNHPSPEHPSIEPLTRLYQAFPYSEEIIERLLQYGGESVVQEISIPILDMYVLGLKQKCARNYNDAIDTFDSITDDAGIILPVIEKEIECAYVLNDKAKLDALIINVPSTSPNVIDIKAERLLEQNNIRDLQSLCVECMESNQECSNNWLAFSFYLQAASDTRVLSSIQRAIKLDKRNRRAHMRAGTHYINSNKKQKAISEFNEAHQIYEDLESFSQLVHGYVAMNQPKIALGYANLCKKLFGEPTNKFGNMALTLEGIATFEINQKNGVMILKEALRLDPSNIEALGKLCDICVNEGQFDDALKLLEDHRSFIEEFPYYYKKGEVYGYKGDYHEALQCMNRALAIQPTNQRTIEMLGHLESIINSMREEEDQGGEVFTFD